MSLSEITRLRQTLAANDKIRDAGLKIPADIDRICNISYGPDPKWNLLDLYLPKERAEHQPVIFDVHGGGWVYGDKDLYAWYCMDLASRGFAVVNFSYRLAPEHPYPSAIEDVNAAFCWLLAHAAEYELDTENLFLVGDSAGAQLATQYIALLQNKNMRGSMGISFPEEGYYIRAVALNCGVYDYVASLRGTLTAENAAYLPVENRTPEILDTLDTMKYLSPAFPPAYIMTSCYDFLKANAWPMYDALIGLGCEALLKEYGNRTQKYMGHVFHLNLHLNEAALCNEDEMAFFRAHMV